MSGFLHTAFDKSPGAARPAGDPTEPASEVQELCGADYHENTGGT